MSNASDFIIENGVLTRYVGSGGDVVIPDGVLEIGSSAFNPYLDGISAKHYDGRKNVKSVTIPEGAQKIGHRAFANCENLKKITVPTSVVRIGANAFHNTAWLKKQGDHVIVNSVYVKYKGTESELTVPEGIVSIADEAFQNCKQITQMHISENVTHIGTRTFCGCEALSSIDIPECVTEIGLHAFGRTPWMAGHAESFVIINGILHCYQGSDTNVSVPDGVTSIGACAFLGCKTIQSVSLPNSVTRIKESAFSGCEKLEMIQLPDGVTSIEKETFYLCTNLKQVSFSQNVKTIAEAAFYRCEKLSKLPDMSAIEAMGELAFYGCKKLKDKDGYLIVGNTLFGYYGKSKALTLPSHVSHVSERALENQEKLTAVFASEAAFLQVWEQLAAPAKYAVAVSCLDTGTLHDAAKAYIKRNKDKIFADIAKRDSVEMMERFLTLTKAPNLDTVEKYIVETSGRTNLTAFLLDYKAKHFSAQQVEELHEAKIETDLGIRERTLKEWKEVFKLSVADGCVRISGYKQNEAVVEIPASMDGHTVTIIGDGAFKANTTIREIVLPTGITGIGSNAFKGCTELRAINIPHAVEKIGFSAFEGCVNLSTCALPDTITSIGGNAFKGCTGLKHMKLPEKLDWICAGLFDGCSALETVSIHDTVSAIYDYAFRDCKSLSKIELPETLAVIGTGAFTNCKALTEVNLPDNVKEIDFFAFRSCTKLAKIRIPATTKKIEANAFNGCKKLTICAPEGCRGANFAKNNKIPFLAE